MSVLDNVKNIKVMPEEHLTDEMSRRMPSGIVGLAPALRTYRTRSKTGTAIDARGTH